MTAIFRGNETCQNAPHIQHFAEKITHTLECQCKIRCIKEWKMAELLAQQAKDIVYITLPCNYLILLITRCFFSICSPSQYQDVYNTVWTAEHRGGCVPWCAFIGNSLLCWSEVQCQKNWNWRNWTASAISWTNKGKTVDQYNCNTKWSQVGASLIDEW